MLPDWRLSARQLILRRISAIVCMYVYIYIFYVCILLYICVTLRNANHNLILYRQTLLFIVLRTGTLRNEYGFGNLIAMNKIIGNLIHCDRVAQQEMIMGLDINNVMDNNWILFCIWHVQLPFLWLSSHSYFHAYQTTPTECTCARLTLCIRISSCYYNSEGDIFTSEHCTLIKVNILRTVIPHAYSVWNSLVQFLDLIYCRGTIKTNYP